MNQNSCTKQLSLIFILMFWVFTIKAQEDQMIRIDRFFGGTVHKTHYPYTLIAEAAYIGSGQLHEVYFNWKEGDSEDTHTTYFGSLNINTQIPIRFEAEAKWLPEQEGFYQIQYWFSGVNEADQETINSPMKEITIEVRDNFVERDLVVLESFSSINCGSCVMASVHLQKQLLHNPTSFKQIYYHPFQYEGSPLNQFNPEDQEVRKNFYNVSSTPNSAIGGLYYGSSFDVDAFLLEKQKSNWAGMQLGGHWKKENEEIRIQLEAEFFITAENPERELYLFIAAIQDSLSFEEPPGTNGEKEFYNLMRFYYPDANGISITDDILHEGYLSLDNTTNLHQDLHIERLEFIAFIQDINTKEILQAATLAFMTDEDNEDPGDEDSDDEDDNTYTTNKLTEENFTITPIPAVDHLYIQNHNRQHINSVSIYDVHGKLIKEVPYGFDDDMRLALHGLSTGIYILKVLFNNNDILARKIILL